MVSSFRSQSSELRVRTLYLEELGCWGRSVLGRPVECHSKVPSLIATGLPQQRRDQLPHAVIKAASRINSLRNSSKWECSALSLT